MLKKKKNVVLLGLLSGEFIFGGAYYWKEFCVSKGVGLDSKNSLKYEDNSLKQLETAGTNSPRAYIREGLLSQGFLRVRFGGGGVFSGGLLLLLFFYFYFYYHYYYFFFGGGGCGGGAYYRFLSFF